MIQNAIINNAVPYSADIVFPVQFVLFYSRTWKIDNITIVCTIYDKLKPLLAFLGVMFYGNNNANQSYLMINFTEELNMRPYLVMQKGVSGIKHINWVIN